MNDVLDLSYDRLEDVSCRLVSLRDRLESAGPIFELDGKRLEAIMKELPHHLVQYDRIANYAKAIHEWLENEKERVEGGYWKKYLERYSRQLSSRDIAAYIAAEAEVVALNVLIIAASQLKMDAVGLVDSLKQIGWMCSHITKLRVHEMEDAIL